MVFILCFKSALVVFLKDGEDGCQKSVGDEVVP